MRTRREILKYTRPSCVYGRIMASYRAKILLCLISFVLLSTLLLVSVYSIMLRRTTIAQGIGQINSYAKIMSTNWKAKLDDYQYELDVAASSDSVLPALSQTPFERRDETLGAINKSLDLFISKSNKGRIEGIYLRIWKDAPDTAIIHKIYTSLNATVIMPVTVDARGQQVFSFFTKPDAEMRALAAIEVKVYETELYELYKDMNRSFEYFVLYGDCVMSSSHRNWRGKPISDMDRLYTELLSADQMNVDAKIDGRDYMIAVETPAVGWRIMVLSERKNLLIGYNQALLTVLAVCAAVVATAVLIAVAVSKHLTRRLNVLDANLLRLRAGDFDTVQEIGGSDEFHNFAVRLDETRKDLKRYISELDKSYAAQQEAEMSVLRAQINSHFLLNTLASLKWLMVAGKTEDAGEGLSVLANYLRVTLRNRRNLIPLKMEMDHISNYRYLMQLRYQDSVIIRIESEPEALLYSTLGFVLQPFVENSLLHAWKSDQRVLTIVIRAQVNDDQLLLSVTDDGVGVLGKPDLLTMETNNNESCGIRNVNLRIKKQWGDRADIRFECLDGGGFHVSIMQPLVKNEGGTS